MRALCPALNRAIVALAPPHVVAARAPADYRELLACGVGRVWHGASDHTIYGDPAVNWAFRAWHDRCHIEHGLPFDYASELAVCDVQCRELLATYPQAPALWLQLIRADVVGQLDHVVAYGAFPVYQAGYIRRMLECLTTTIPPLPASASR